MICSLDTSTIIYIHKYKLNAELGKLYLEKLDNLEFIISEVVIKEIKNREFRDFLKNNYPNNIVPNTKEVQEYASMLINKYTGWVKNQTIKNNKADPFVISLAHVEKGIVLTRETTSIDSIKSVKSIEPQNLKLPHVCKMEKIECIDLNDYLFKVLRP